MSDGMSDERRDAREAEPEVVYPAVIPREEGHAAANVSARPLWSS